MKYHLGQTGVFESRNGNTIPVELAANPSHLEAVDPVVVGMVRAKMDLIDVESDYDEYPVLPLLIHGDAAFAGQGSPLLPRVVQSRRLSDPRCQTGVVRVRSRFPSAGGRPGGGVGTCTATYD